MISVIGDIHVDENLLDALFDETDNGAAYGGW